MNQESFNLQDAVFHASVEDFELSFWSSRIRLLVAPEYVECSPAPRTTFALDFINPYSLQLTGFERGSHWSIDRAEEQDHEQGVAIILESHSGPCLKVICNQLVIQLLPLDFRKKLGHQKDCRFVRPPIEW